MAEQGHTPGPWTFRPSAAAAGDYADGFASFQVESQDWIVAAVIADVAELRDAGEANARLIAAAPDLLAALKGLIPTNVCLRNQNVGDEMVLPCDVTLGELRAAAAAIAKAEGGAS